MRNISQNVSQENIALSIKEDFFSKALIELRKTENEKVQEKDSPNFKEELGRKKFTREGKFENDKQRGFITAIASQKK